MTQYNPFLKLNRLTIYTKNGKTAYDQNFNEGVNINVNSSKSSPGNYFLCLGDFKNNSHLLRDVRESYHSEPNKRAVGDLATNQ